MGFEYSDQRASPSIRRKAGGEMRFFSVAEAAAILELSEKSIRGAIRRGELPASKVCGRLRIAKHDLKNWVATNTVRAQVGTPRSPAALGRSNGRREGAFRNALERIRE